MDELSTIYDYMRSYAPLLGERILQEYPATTATDVCSWRLPIIKATAALT
jgi:hypothetical protein